MKTFLYLKVMALGYEEHVAKALIHGEKVLVNDSFVRLPYFKLQPEDVVRIKDESPYVSRGAYKLLAALEHFCISLANKVVLDIGSSTGGFTQVALAQHARLVYALDVGKNQLDYRLRVDPRVIVFEQTNIRDVTSQMFEEVVNVVLCDVSFISLGHIFKKLSVLAWRDLELIVLIKPQFEADRSQVEPGGFVPETFHLAIIERVLLMASACGFKLQRLLTSPIKGQKSQNTEYLAYFQQRGV